MTSADLSAGEMPDVYWNHDGWALFPARPGLLLLLADPDSETALDDCLESDLWTGGPCRWLGRLIAETPIGWDVYLYEFVPLELLKPCS